MNRLAPAHYFSPKILTALNRARLNIDIVGMTAVRLFVPYTMSLPGWLQLVISVYNIMATITVLTVDPTRFPEAGTTRIKQKQAWKFTLKLLPIFIVVVSSVVWSFDLSLQKLAIPSVGLLIACYVDELLFRNILQPKLRTLGLSKRASIGLQSLLYAFAFLTVGFSLGSAIIACVLGLFNGWIVYKYRSLWPAFVVSLIVHIFLLAKVV
jgi:membrane protease YdiL (CAAX protease family)